MRAVPAVVALIVAGSLIVAKEAQKGHATSVKTVVSAVQLAPEERSGVRGVAFFRQRGQRLSGWVAVWGLRPRTAHAVHFHAPGRCGGTPADPVAAHNDLVANGDGVAFATISVQVTGQVLRQRVYYNVHRRPAAAGKSPSVACGDVRPEENGG